MLKSNIVENTRNGTLIESLVIRNRNFKTKLIKGNIT